ncbi:hypothetical protein ZWY2020_023623 [Hordeum vulgare]|nr:hypothetical protein ZWY2020_023623 [Hordeum vulgare]
MKFVRRHRRDLPKIDRLIKLPDDVLLNILERVGTLDAVRTCVLSKQTLKLPALLSQIVIVPSARDLRWKNRQVVDMTDKVLSTRFPHIPIRALKLRFIMRGDDHLRIGRSVALAMAKQKQKVDAAEFEILTRGSTMNTAMTTSSPSRSSSTILSTSARPHSPVSRGCICTTSVNAYVEYSEYSRIQYE